VAHEVTRLRRDVIRWRCHTRLRKYADDAAFAADIPYEVLEIDGNILLHGGASALWHRLTGGTSVSAFSNANAHIGVGDSATAAAATQTDLQAATNKLRKAMDSTYPLHTDGTGSGAHQIVFRSTFGSSDANFTWAEWGIFNAASSGRMLNRKVEALGTKATGTWQITLTLSLSS
jgi:hypothetical protein